MLTFAVATFNQEAFIRAALEGAFAQTYRPLEILISDDASTDHTFAIARELVAAYRGPHTVRLNRNESNLGIAGHANRIMELRRGELLIAAAGDDISLPERAEAIYQAWEFSGRRATSIFSSYITLSAEGTEVGVGGTRGDPADATLYRPQRGELLAFLAQQWPVVVGCTHAWSPKLFEYFGPLRGDLEDLVLSFRSLAIGEMLYIHRPLVKYRRHGSNVSFFAGQDDARTLEFVNRENRLRWVDEKSAAAYDNILADIETLYQRQRLSAAERDRLRCEAERVRSYYAIERQLMDQNIIGRVQTLAGAAACGNFRHAVRFLPRALPRPVYRTLWHLREKWRAKG